MWSAVSEECHSFCLDSQSWLTRSVTQPSGRLLSPRMGTFWWPSAMMAVFGDGIVSSDPLCHPDCLRWIMLGDAVCHHHSLRWIMLGDALCHPDCLRWIISSDAVCHHHSLRWTMLGDAVITAWDMIVSSEVSLLWWLHQVMCHRGQDADTFGSQLCWLKWMWDMQAMWNVCHTVIVCMNTLQRKCGQVVALCKPQTQYNAKHAAQVWQEDHQGFKTCRCKNSLAVGLSSGLIFNIFIYILLQFATVSFWKKHRHKDMSNHTTNQDI